MDKITKILLDYTSGKTPLEETNRALEDAGSDIRLNPAKNLFTPEELLATHTGETPEEAEGYGLLDTGTGSMEKVHVTAGVLDEHDRLRADRRAEVRGEGRRPDLVLTPAASGGRA